MDLREVGKRLKNAREKTGMKQKEAAIKVGISNDMLCRYEKGQCTPPYDILVKLADLYEIEHIDYLLGRNGKNGTTPPAPWHERDAPPTEADLEEIIKTYPELNLFGEPLDEGARDDLLKIIQATWEIISQKKKRPEQAREK